MADADVFADSYLDGLGGGLVYPSTQSLAATRSQGRPGSHSEPGHAYGCLWLTLGYNEPMIDIRLIREETEAVKAACRHKNAGVTAQEVDDLLKLDGERREVLGQLDELRRQRNELASAVKQGKPSAEQIVQGKRLKTQLTQLEETAARIETEYTALLKRLPNLPAADVPVGRTEDDNVVVRTVGEPPRFDFEPRNHWQLAELHDWIDKAKRAPATLAARSLSIQS